MLNFFGNLFQAHNTINQVKNRNKCQYDKQSLFALFPVGGKYVTYTAVCHKQSRKNSHNHKHYKHNRIFNAGHVARVVFIILVFRF